jgi:hypothetical protein
MAVSEFTDCELNLNNYTQAELRVGNVAYSGTLSLGPEHLQDKLLELALDPQEYGEKLFAALFPAGSDLLAGYQKALAISRREEIPLHLRLRIAVDAPFDLHTLNWERLFDSAQHLALGRARDIVFSRYLSVDRELPAALKVNVPKMLVIVSGPKNLVEYQLADIEKDRISAMLRTALSQLANQVEYEFLEGPATPANISDSVVGSDFHALHIYAHGVTKNKKAYLILEDKEGNANHVDENIFSEMLEGAHSLRLITLVACRGGAQLGNDPFGGLGPSLVRMGFPAVVAMQQEIGTDTADVFTEHFYRSLARTGQVDVAVNAARRQIFLNDSEDSDWSAPALFMRLETGKLWSSTGVSADERQATPELTADENFNWQPILAYLPEGKVVPMIGPEINLGLLPSQAEITERWAKEFDYEKYNYPLNDRNDLPRVAQFVETMSAAPKFPHQQLLNIFKKDLLKQEKVVKQSRLAGFTLAQVIEEIAQQHFDRDENDPYEILAKLPISNYLTTNPDSFMEEALKFEKRAPQRENALWQEDDNDIGNERYQKLRGTNADPVVFHLYGSSAASLVLTEDDHLDFLRFVSKDSWRIPQYLKADLTESVLLFLGYNIRNLDFRVAFKGLVGQLKKASPGRIAILQLQPEKDFQQQIQDLRLLQSFMEKDCANLKLQVYWGSVRKFLIGLWNKFNQ